MNITVIGTGYVGLVSGTCLAELGHTVTCYDTDHKKIKQLQKGILPIYEPGLKEMVIRNINNKQLYFCDSLRLSCTNAQNVILAVGTPAKKEDGSVDTTYIYQAVNDIAAHLPNKCIIITKSTVPVGTGKAITALLHSLCPNHQFDVVSNPEFLREGCAVKDFLQPDRIIIGTTSPAAKQNMQKLYQPLIDQGIPALFTDIASAELIKYAANAFLATKIAFTNEIADICEGVGANIDIVIKGMGMDQRIGGRYMQPGPGFGGSCFPKDTLALAQIGKNCGFPSDIITAVITANNKRKNRMVEKIVTACGNTIKNKTLAILGLAFKANTDDMRESASLTIIPALLAQGAQVRIYDPICHTEAKKYFSHDNIHWSVSETDAVTDADAVIIVTEWPQFKKLDLHHIKNLLKTPLLIDLRNLFCTEEMNTLGFTYLSIGR